MPLQRQGAHHGAVHKQGALGGEQLRLRPLFRGGGGADIHIDHAGPDALRGVLGAGKGAEGGNGHEDDVRVGGQVRRTGYLFRMDRGPLFRQFAGAFGIILHGVIGQDAVDALFFVEAGGNGVARLAEA